MRLALRFAARSDVGMVRAKNDDSAYAGRFLAVVADGMGGHAGGNVASASTVLDLVHLDHDGHDGAAGTHLADEIQTANSLLSELVATNPQLAGMGTTVTALLLEGSTLQLAHIGDSRAYRLKNDVFEQITTDHTFVQRLIDEGRLRPEEAEVHPHKNVLMRVLGDVDASPELDLEAFEAAPGERWLLCSDGLNAVLNDRMVEQVVREASTVRDCVNTLVELTLAGGSPDNITIAVVEVIEADDDDAAPPVSIPPARQAAGERDIAQDPSTASREIDRNGDLPGTAIRADVIRRDLLTRPHVLVGSAALATETGQIPIVTQRSTERRAAMVLTHRAESDTAEETEEEPAARARRWLVPTFLSLMTLILVAVLGIGYTWTQTRYYVAEADNRVAVFTGVPQRIGPISLSELYETTDIPVSNLPQYQRSQLASTLPAASLEEAERIVGDLRSELRAVPCGPGTRPVTASPTASPTPSGADGTGRSGSASAPSVEPTGSRSGGATPSPSRSPSASPTASSSASSSSRASAAPSNSSDASPEPTTSRSAVAAPLSPDCGGAENE
ncbi:PP2C-family Ser/Thr phosphatase [Arthrobacter agilis]|uniref:PP2C family protein-serine/threonine phosphatase n=2 Tax=Arthrobacter agilis TaxID=37921 RepID=UPI000F70CE60|nr:protein phosphatase 2C domain-containing protein [Arthrobacter agilis]VDR30775.1 PP2C-family Ser/Thr phosphatase [Arthrobacter agilis]